MSLSNAISLFSMDFLERRDCSEFVPLKEFFTGKTKLREVEGGSKLQPPVESKPKQFYHTNDIR